MTRLIADPANAPVRRSLVDLHVAAADDARPRLAAGCTAWHGRASALPAPRPWKKRPRSSC